MEPYAALAIDAAIEIVKEEVKSGGSVQLISFGTFERRERATRAGFNPATNEKIEIAASKVPTFKPGKPFSNEQLESLMPWSNELKQSINSRTKTTSSSDE